MSKKKVPHECPECGADLDEVGLMTDENVLGTNVTLAENDIGPVFLVNSSETTNQMVMCGECGEDISASFSGFKIIYGTNEY